MALKFQSICERSQQLNIRENKDRIGLTPSFLPCGKAGGLQIRRCQGFAVGLLRLHPWRLGSEALRLLQHYGKCCQRCTRGKTAGILPLTSLCLALFRFQFIKLGRNGLPPESERNADFKNNPRYITFFYISR
jgi:hypothetical protein